MELKEAIIKDKIDDLRPSKARRAKTRMPLKMKHKYMETLNC
jgi:hypothetical protein